MAWPLWMLSVHHLVLLLVLSECVVGMAASAIAPAAVAAIAPATASGAAGADAAAAGVGVDVACSPACQISPHSCRHACMR